MLMQMLVIAVAIVIVVVATAAKTVSTTHNSEPRSALCIPLSCNSNTRFTVILPFSVAGNRSVRYSLGESTINNTTCSYLQLSFS